ncbi:hypothetical protein [Streptomyces sp. NPDC093089]|uniref:hypothetical protein n=1 Tax=Streptomyces sp. NPDC093089 TaxID=3366024 RepID=UPI00380B7681
MLPFLAAQLLGSAAGLGLVAVCFGRPATAGEGEVPVPRGTRHPAAPTPSAEGTAPAR